MIVIGAGLAGMSSAYELTQAGHEVMVLEARTRSVPIERGNSGARDVIEGRATDGGGSAS